MVLEWDFRVIEWDLLVVISTVLNVYITTGKDPPFIMGKLTVSMGHVQ